MKFFALAATFLAAVSATGSPKRTHGKCLSQSTAENIVGQFITILNHYDVPAANATAQALLAEDFTETSDSILSLEGRPVRQP